MFGKVHWRPFHTIINQLNTIQETLNRIEKREIKQMATLDAQVQAILDKVTAQSGEADSIAILLAEYHKALLDALASQGVVISPETQAKLDAVAAGLVTNSQKIADAVAANPLPAPPAG